MDENGWKESASFYKWVLKKKKEKTLFNLLIILISVVVYDDHDQRTETGVHDRRKRHTDLPEIQLIASRSEFVFAWIYEKVSLAAS